jgi:hydroxymethylpyrimidine/phosphomethylpyrimidine kinase
VQNQTPPLVLSFNVTDPVGAIGIQADLASFAAMGCHGLSVVTAIAIGDTARIEDVQLIDADWVADQARVLLEDMPVAAFKIGPVGSIDTVSVLAEIMSDYPEVPMVLDPFASAMPHAGQDGEEVLVAMRELLVPQATLTLLSALELARFGETWREHSSRDLLMQDAMHLVDLGCRHVLVTGTPAGMHEVANSLFNETGRVRHDCWPRQAGAYSGAGSTLSATIAAMLANGLDVPEAALEAQEFLLAALANARRMGMGKLIPDRLFWARDPDDAA